MYHKEITVYNLGYIMIRFGQVGTQPLQYKKYTFTASLCCCQTEMGWLINNNLSKDRGEPNFFVTFLYQNEVQNTPLEH